MVVAQGQALGHVRSHTAEVAGDALADRFQRLPPACARRGMGADEFARAMIDRDEHIPLMSFGSVSPLQKQRNRTQRPILSL